MAELTALVDRSIPEWKNISSVCLAFLALPLGDSASSQSYDLRWDDP